MKTTYTVINTSGAVLLQGASVTEAATEILEHDGHDYEVRREGDAFQLFVSRASHNAAGGNRGMTEAWSHSRLIRSYAASEAEAWAEIAAQVLAAGWDGSPYVMIEAD